jgi:hypothetical protein
VGEDGPGVLHVPVDDRGEGVAGQEGAGVGQDDGVTSCRVVCTVLGQ